MKKSILNIIIVIAIILGYSFINNNTDNYITKIVNYNGNNLKISIDEQVSSTLPTSGTYYLVDYDCSNVNTIVTWNNNDYSLSITNGTKKGSVSCNLEFKSKPLLSEMPVGSYVKYVGNNGCKGRVCEGQNANYVSDTDMGYCNDKNYKFHENGFRIAYIENGSAYLISAGATDCMCTDSKGVSSNTSCSDYLLSSAVLVKHFENMDSIALKYCNSKYANGGVCNENTAWAMDTNDFEKIVGKSSNLNFCYGKFSNMSCGYTNDLIDNGGYYWFASSANSSLENIFTWTPSRYVYEYNSGYLNGIRPVLYLDPKVIVTGGTGTYSNPYTIDIQEDTPIGMENNNTVSVGE